MNRTTLKVTLLVVSLLAFQLGLSTPFIPTTQINQGLPSVSAIQAPIGLMTSFSVNTTNPSEAFDIPITVPGVYRINVTCTVDSGLPAPGPDISVEYAHTMNMWLPQIGGFPTLNSFDSTSWSNVPENDTRSREIEIFAVQPGSIRIDFGISGTSTDDLVSGTVATYQELNLATLPYGQPIGLNTTLHFTQDASWMGVRLNIPISNFYNISTFSEMDWSTTAGWGGTGSFTPFDAMVIMDPVHGEHMPYDTWNPSFSIPAGADTNSSTWGPAISYHVLEAGDYYLIGKTDDFEFLNGTFADFTINIATIPTQVVLPSVPLQLSFNTTPNVYDTYIAVTIPEGHYFNMQFSTPVGHNWSVFALDAWSGSYSGLYYETYESPSSFYTNRDNLERGWATATGSFSPYTGVLGDPYYEIWQAEATWGIYSNGTKVATVPPSGMGAISRFNTFYYHVIGSPLATPSTTFRININFEITPFPTLTTSGLICDFNSTMGPLYHLFQLPQASGVVYEVSALATSYTTAGTVRIEEMWQPIDYENWQWMTMFAPPLAYADPPYGMGAPASQNTNDTATLTFVAVKDGINYLWVQGPGMSGIGGDMTEATVSLKATPPIPYALGTVASVAVTYRDFAAYTFNVEAGTTYYLEMTLQPDGDTVFGTFFNIFGYSPFVISSLFQLFVVTGTGMPYGLTYRGSFTAQVSGRVTFVVSGSTPTTSTVAFYLYAVIPVFSLPIIAAIGLTAIVMLAIGILVGYVLLKRRFTS